MIRGRRCAPRIGQFGEDADLKDGYDTERQLLSMACMQAQDFPSVSGVEPTLEFLED